MRFYRERVPAGSSLPDFPLINRDVVQKHFADFLAARRFPDFLIMSGGTSGKIANTTFRNEEEFEAVYQYLYDLRPGDYLDLDQIEGFGIDIFFNTNGYTRRKPRGWPLLSIPLERKAHVDLMTNLLTNGLQLGGRTIPVRYLQSQNALHRVLAGYFAVGQSLPNNLKLSTVFGYGSHISRVWESRLATLWGCVPETTYGLSEFAGSNAVRCSECGALHYLTAWQEFLSARDHTPVEQGDALLVLTSLLPFVSLQPRVRYNTEDVVSIEGRCDATGLVGFRFRGRLSHTVWQPDPYRGRALLSEIDVIEVLDQLVEVYARPHPAEIQLWSDCGLAAPPFPMGPPQFKITTDGQANSFCITVEVIFDPAKERTRARDFEDRLRSLLYEEVPSLSHLLMSGQLEMRVELMPAGGLGLHRKLSA